MDHRTNLTHAAILLFRRQGFAATGLNQIVAMSGAPKGSLYHYFPDGKEELGATAVRVAGGLVAERLQTLADESVSFADFLSRYLHLAASWLEESEYREGCPIATVLLELAPESQRITAAGRAIVDEWIKIVAAVLRRDGSEDALRQARGVVAAVEGGLLLARVQGSVEALLGLQAVLRRSVVDRKLENQQGEQSA